MIPGDLAASWARAGIQRIARGEYLLRIAIAIMIGIAQRVQRIETPANFQTVIKPVVIAVGVIAHGGESLYFIEIIQTVRIGIR